MAEAGVGTLAGLLGLPVDSIYIAGQADMGCCKLLSLVVAGGGPRPGGVWEGEMRFVKKEIG